MLRVANAVSDGVDPRDWTKLKSNEILIAAEARIKCEKNRVKFEDKGSNK